MTSSQPIYSWAFETNLGERVDAAVAREAIAQFSTGGFGRKVWLLDAGAALSFDPAALAEIGQAAPDLGARGLHTLLIVAPPLARPFVEAQARQAGVTQAILVFATRDEAVGWIRRGGR